MVLFPQSGFASQCTAGALACTNGLNNAALRSQGRLAGRCSRPVTAGGVLAVPVTGEMCYTYRWSGLGGAETANPGPALLGACGGAPLRVPYSRAVPAMDWLFQRRADSSDVESFWRDIERRLDERVEVYGLGEQLSGWNLSQTGSWFVVFVTRTAVHFYRPPRSSWVGALLGTPAGAHEELEYRIPAERLTTVEVPQRSTRSGGIWGRIRQLLKRREQGVLIRYSDAQGGSREVVFRFDTNRTELVGALQRLCSGN